MPNKYSHALVLSHYESSGLTDFDRLRDTYSRVSTNCPPSPPSKSPPRPIKPNPSSRSAPQPYESRLYPSSKERIFLQPSPPGLQADFGPLLQKNSDSVETQIYAPAKSPPPSPSAATSRQRTSQINDNEPFFKSRPVRRHASRETVCLLESPTLEELQQVPSKLQFRDSRRFAGSPTQCNGSIKEKAQSPGELREDRRRHSTETEVYAPLMTEITPRRDSNPKQTTCIRKQKRQQGRMEPPSYATRQLASPPLAPQARYSFSLDSHPHALAPPPAPALAVRDQSFHRTLPSPSSKESIRPTSLPQSSDQSHLGRSNSAVSRLQEAPRHSPGRISIASRSSLRLTTVSPTFSNRSSSNVTVSPILENPDTDLDSLSDWGAELEPHLTTLDFDNLPWGSPRTPISNNHNSSNDNVSPPTTRASSFDSAAPPPISRTPRTPPPNRQNNEPRQKTTPARLKTTIPSLFKPIVPKAIPYSQTTQGHPPRTVSVSRTGTPSIPALFPHYQGSFPAVSSPKPPSTRTTTPQPHHPTNSHPLLPPARNASKNSLALPSRRLSFRLPSSVNSSPTPPPPSSSSSSSRCGSTCTLTQAQAQVLPAQGDSNGGSPGSSRNVSKKEKDKKRERRRSWFGAGGWDKGMWWGG